MRNTRNRKLRQIDPRKELHARDQRSGAYPTLKSTGDSTRTGKNNVFFDDAQTVIFNQSVTISHPSTFQSGSKFLVSDLTGAMSFTTGSVNIAAVDQLIPHHDQSERIGPFKDSDLYEQDQTNVTNSNFMTGSAASVAAGKFKTKLSDKTIVRMEVPLAIASTLSTNSSSLHYLNTVSGTFQKIADEISFNVTRGNVPSTFAPLPFTPYGMHHLPFNAQIQLGNASMAEQDASKLRKQLASYTGDGSDESIYGHFQPAVTRQVTASLQSPQHAASDSQVLKLSSALSHPFLLEKIVIEMPFAAGAGWLNDAFGVRYAIANDLQTAIDVGGPMITLAVLRQDRTNGGARDLIASGTITTALDMLTGTYLVSTATYVLLNAATDILVTPEGVGSFMNVGAVITGSTLSGSSNTYTGSVTLVMEPQVTAHAMRLRSSGSSNFYYFGANGFETNATQATGIGLGPEFKRSVKFPESGRNVYGNHIPSLNADDVAGTTEQVHVIDSQYENLQQKHTVPRIRRTKVYLDVVSDTIKTPYLLNPEDDLIFCLSKHRAVATPGLDYWTYDSDTAIPHLPVSQHDVKIPAGIFKVTMYGNLIKEDHEFHDTLNQRLETEEIYSVIGHEPVLDQFDVTYRNELANTHLDRFTVFGSVQYAQYGQDLALTSSLETTGSYSDLINVDTQDNKTWSTQRMWSTTKKISELKNNPRLLRCTSENELLFDCRVPEPKAAFRACNPSFRLYGLDMLLPDASDTTSMTFTIYSGDSLEAGSGTTQASGTGVRDWYMTYPYEQRYDGLSQTFTNTLKSTQMSWNDPGSATVKSGNVKYERMNVELGQPSSSKYRVVAGENDGTYTIGLSLPEFIKTIYGIGDGHSSVDNQHVTFRGTHSSMQTRYGADIRGWRYGMHSAFPSYSSAVFRRDRYGQIRDMLEQRQLTKFNDVRSVGAVSVQFHDQRGKLTDSLRTLASNLSFEVTSSVPYDDTAARNRPALDRSILNISNVTF